MDYTKLLRRVARMEVRVANQYKPMTNQTQHVKGRLLCVTNIVYPLIVSEIIVTKIDLGIP
jgi:hypothetical protein